MAKKSSGELIVEDTRLTEKSLKAMHRYFDEPSKENREVAGEAVRLMGLQSRVLASRANEAAITVMTAKHMGLKGEALAPLWQRLTGTKASDFANPQLPAPEAA